MRSARLLLAGICAAAVALLALVAALRTTDQAFTLGVVNRRVAVAFEPGQSVCQRPIAVPAGGGFDRVTFTLGTFGGTGPPMELTVRDRNGRLLGTGRLPGGYPDITVVPHHQVGVGHIVGGDGVAVCLINRGDRRVAVFGGDDGDTRSSTAYLEGRPVQADLGLTFQRPPRSLATLAHWMFYRASLFRTPIAGTWLYATLAVLLMTLVPALLLRALRTASSD